MDFDAILQAARTVHASDIHLCPNQPIRVRVAGRLQSLDVPIFGIESLQDWLKSNLTEQQYAAWLARVQVDFAIHDVESAARLSIYPTHDGTAVAVRLLPKMPPTLAELGAPEFIETLSPTRHGLVLVTGATGSGKSTTMASWIAHVNRLYDAHILTLEDPIEYFFKSDRCLIRQTELDKDTDYNTALRDALRRDPDAIVMGELRDLASIEMALRAAETGHLVIATLHSSNAVGAVARLIDVFPSESKSFVRHVLSNVLLGVVAQRLVHCNTNVRNGGRIATYEVLTCTAAVKNLIKEAKEAQLSAVMQSSAAHQMFTFSQHFQKLLDAHLVEGPMPIGSS
ncbi:type IV pilus twitching motility protein PilT [Hydromonas duriensis]|uniref:Twitching motility protein PilT n=1 Tax=Hydromonas duriensis TaxID=1527608 RepID=A0A4R6YBT0_9BURK|nr:PilT/PilU family type 4a pilus ATPase [Hydromonas duriensis]TDR33126.1 twitching motility protein PilT [Hydromonas duriensis]